LSDREESRRHWDTYFALEAQINRLMPPPI
jgi:hypothetical protein